MSSPFKALRVASLLVLFSATAASAGAEAVLDPCARCAGLEEFTAAVRDYVALHERLAASLPRQEVTADVARIHRTTKALQTAIRTARADARQGDLFSHQIGEIVRLRIQAALRARGFNGHDVVAAMHEDEEECLIAERPVVNGALPWSAGAVMLPSLIRALPALPAGLEYRFADRDLVLVDVDASLVVDLLEDALPL